jgi:hypothetical protein
MRPTAFKNRLTRYAYSAVPVLGSLLAASPAHASFLSGDALDAVADVLAWIVLLWLLSLFFGGMLWPFAWLWAYTKPVIHKLAYGTDVEEPHKVVEPVDDEHPVIVDSKLERRRIDEHERHSAEV